MTLEILVRVNVGFLECDGRCYVNRLRDLLGSQGTLTIDGTGYKMEPSMFVVG